MSTDSSQRHRLSQSQVDVHGVHTSLIKAAVLREISEGVVPDRQNIKGAIPFNLMKSEKLVWVFSVNQIQTWEKALADGATVISDQSNGTNKGKEQKNKNNDALVLQRRLA